MNVLWAVIVSCLLLTSAAVAGDDIWAFPGPTDSDGERVLDLRCLNEEVAGQSGFVHRSEDGNELLLGDGEPVRFWAVSMPPDCLYLVLR